MVVRNLTFDSPQPPSGALGGPAQRQGVWSVVLRPASKRALDVTLSATLLLVLLPVFLAIAVVVAGDGGSALYSHRRVGRGGRTFGCLKFRSMRPNADRLLAELLAREPSARAEWEATRKLRRDPRVTPIGRLLRATSLDELPQLINVLRGDMSLVGPRPVVQEELDQHYAPAAAAADYLSVRPGVTGLWQVSGRSDTDYRERVALDAHYARNPSLRKDLVLLALTVVVVLRCRGAY
jgi:lipopolysaccharide/colanic/teichoic acid biosynthesis glycosyltransferase